MILNAFKYRCYKDTSREWSIEGKPSENKTDDDRLVKLGSINLIVGRNASGKTKTIKAIRQIADLLCGEAKLSDPIHDTGFIPDTAEYTLLFKDGDSKIEYFVEFKEKKIIQEILRIDDNEKLNRAERKLFYNEIGRNLSFNPNDDSLSISRQDSEQQPFFDSLYTWGKTLNHYQFGDQLGKNVFIQDINKIDKDVNIDLKNGDDVIEALVNGKELNHDFVDCIIRDMSSVDYPLNSVDASKLKHLPRGFGLTVSEQDLNDLTDQLEMSQGMFRTLSLLIQINYSLLLNQSRCILIDDIGEGLDYDRSRKLIDLIIDKVKNSTTQVIMTTNDQFVMNKVPLEYWSLIKREKHKSVFYNYDNSRKVFDDFEFTGLDNFSFFSSNYYQIQSSHAD